MNLPFHYAGQNWHFSTARNSSLTLPILLILVFFIPNSRMHLKATLKGGIWQSENLGLDTFPVSQVDLQKFAFWDHRCPAVILDQAQYKKDSTVPAFYKSKCLEIRCRYEDHEALFTNWSKDEKRAGAAAYKNVETYSCQLPDDANVFSAELKALLLAHEHVCKS